MRQALVSLEQRIFGEQLDATEQEATWQLFVNLQTQGHRAIEANEVPKELDHHCGKNAGAVREDPMYTLRAWSGVISYMLQDDAFLLSQE